MNYPLVFHKSLNDTLGHDVGDLVLQETATRLKEAVRFSDTVFRLGGDEFLILVKNVNEISDIQKIVINIIESFETPAMIRGHSIKILLSIGIAISPDDSEKSCELIKFSDIAMYEAKHDKDTQYKFFDKNMLKPADSKNK